MMRKENRYQDRWNIVLLVFVSVFLQVFWFKTAYASKAPQYIPILVYPFDGETTVSIPISLKWFALKEDSSFELEIGRLIGNDYKPEYYSYDIAVKEDKSVEIFEECKLRMHGKEIPGRVFSFDLPKTYGALYDLLFWRVRVRKEVPEKQWSKSRSFLLQQNYWLIQDDLDDDDIPYDDEMVFGTNPNMRTLFVKPIKENDDGSETYWPKFIQLFPDSGMRRGFAEIKPLFNAGIEVVVIGCETTSGCHEDYSKFDDFSYNPKESGDIKPYDILEIIYKREKSLSGVGINCNYTDNRDDAGRPAEGHIYFKSYQTQNNATEIATWFWDTKGYTPMADGIHGYHKPRVFSFPLNNYFEEGAYDSIEVYATPYCLNCNRSFTDSCCKCYRSPMNKNMNSTVEFNKIVYDLDGKINSILWVAEEYTIDEVLKRTIAHEICHAILGIDGNDGHCSNPTCLLYEFTVDWIMHELGPIGACRHYDQIRRSGIIHNENR